MLSNELHDRVEEYCKRYGISKSSLVAYAVGQHLDQLERMNQFVYGSDGMMQKLAEVIKEEVDGSKE